MKRFLLLLLLTLPTCASLPVQPDIPPLPRAVPTRKGLVPVTLVHHLYCKDAPAYGCYYSSPPRIEIEDTLSPAMRQRYLGHEIFHAALRASNLKFNDDDQEDVVAEAMGEQRLAEIRAGWPP